MKGKTETLRRELEQLYTQIAALEAALEERPDYGLGEGDPAITRQELDRVMLQRLRERVESLEQALAQADGATYGICAQCGRPIHPDRLAVLPDARLCIRCARAGEREGATGRSGVRETKSRP
jgi:RNA polymerase-binding transcription factor DksA